MEYRVGVETALSPAAKPFTTLLFILSVVPSTGMLTPMPLPGPIRVTRSILRVASAFVTVIPSSPNDTRVEFLIVPDVPVK